MGMILIALRMKGRYMILKSKLSKTAYPTANPADWLTGNIEGLDTVFAGRLAACAKATNTKIHITSGYRSLAEQKKLYADYKAGKLQSTAAVPGTSFHGSGLAIDTSTQPIRGMTNAQLAKYGLCKPISKELWHIQTLETINMGINANTAKVKAISPVDLSSELKVKFNLGDTWISNIENYTYGTEFAEKLLNGVKEFSPETIEYFSKFDYWKEFKVKTGIK